MGEFTHNPLENLREHVIEQLSVCYSRDFLSHDEFETRIETATAADTHADLRALVVDLPAVETTAPAEDARRNSEPAPAEQETLVAIFSGADRTGVWQAPRKLNAVAVFGGSDIDLRDAVIPRDGLRISAYAVFGGIEIVVPEGVRIEMSGVGLFGEFSGRERLRTTAPDAPVVRVEGIAVFGAVEVKHRKPRDR